MPDRQFLVTSSPHLRHTDTTRGIMLDVILALCPALVSGIFLFGWRAALVVAVCIVSAVLAEWICCKLRHRPSTISDLSAVVTGLLLGLNLTSRLPLWMAALGSVIAIVVVKQMFGGIGHNFANPAITARIVLLVSFPTAMTTWAEPFSDAISSATPLAGGTYTLQQFLLGTHAGCIGETSSLMLLIGGLYLCLRRVISPIIPVCFIGSAALLSWAFGMDPLTTVLSGGLLLGAIFMATDYVTSPPTKWGKVIFGIGCGLITILIRRFGASPEGVSYAILLMNILVPHITRLTTPKPFGWEAPTA